MNKELYAAAEAVAQKYMETSINAMFSELVDIMQGNRSANYDHKRVLCNEVNAWFEYWSAGDMGKIPLYRVTPDGVIETYYPTYEPAPVLNEDTYGTLS